MGAVVKAVQPLALRGCEKVVAPVATQAAGESWVSFDED